MKVKKAKYEYYFLNTDFSDQKIGEILGVRRETVWRARQNYNKAKLQIIVNKPQKTPKQEKTENSMIEIFKSLTMSKPQADDKLQNLKIVFRDMGQTIAKQFEKEIIFSEATDNFDEIEKVFNKKIKMMQTLRKALGIKEE